MRRSAIAAVVIMGIVAVRLSMAGGQSGITLEEGVDDIFAERADRFDVNNDGRVTAADVVARLIDDFRPTPASTLSATAMPTATASAMESPTPTVTMTVTPPPTPTSSPQPSSTPEGLLYDGTIDQLVPHAAGDQLIYRVTNPDHTIQTETETVRTSSVPDGFVVESIRGTLHLMDAYVDAGHQLLFSVETDPGRGVRTTCQPSSVRLKMPLIAGETVMTTSSCEIRYIDGNFFAGRFTLTETVTPLETVLTMTVPAGTYAPVFRLRFTSTLGQEDHDVYIAAGVGIIRRTVVSGSGTRIYELKDGSIGGQSVRRGGEAAGL